jgi:hypothetical protein
MQEQEIIKAKSVIRLQLPLEDFESIRVSAKQRLLYNISVSEIEYDDETNLMTFDLYIRNVTEKHKNQRLVSFIIETFSTKA